MSLCTRTVTCAGFQDVVPYPQGRFSFSEASVGIAGGSCWENQGIQGGEEASDGERLTQDPEHRGQSPAASLPGASQGRQSPPGVHRHGSSKAWRWGGGCRQALSPDIWKLELKLGQLWERNMLGWEVSTKASPF